MQRRQDALAAHALTVPEPPLTLNFPHLTSRSSVTLLSAEQATVDQRLTTPVSLALSGGDRLVVTGPNGAGKSTLLQVLAQDLQPSSGHVERQTGVRVGSLQQESELPSKLQIRQLFESHVHRLIATGLMSDKNAVSLSDLGLLGADELQMRVGELSMGQQRRLEFGVSVSEAPKRATTG